MTATTGEPIGGAAVRGGAGRLPRSYYVAAAIAPLLVLALWGALLLIRPGAPVLARIGEPAPAFALADLEGNPVSLAELRGRPVIVNFWASWCGPCVDEFPLLDAAATAHRSDGLAVVGLVVQDRSEAARAVLQRTGATWPAAMDPGDAVATRFGVVWPPASFFVDRDGVVVGRQLGQLTGSDLERGLAQILEEE